MVTARRKIWPASAPTTGSTICGSWRGRRDRRCSPANRRWVGGELLGKRATRMFAVARDLYLCSCVFALLAAVLFVSSDGAPAGRMRTFLWLDLLHYSFTLCAF